MQNPAVRQMRRSHGPNGTKNQPFSPAANAETPRSAVKNACIMTAGFPSISSSGAYRNIKGMINVISPNLHAASPVFIKEAPAISAPASEAGATGGVIMETRAK